MSSKFFFLSQIKYACQAVAAFSHSMSFFSAAGTLICAADSIQLRVNKHRILRIKN